MTGLIALSYKFSVFSSKFSVFMGDLLGAIVSYWYANAIFVAVLLLVLSICLESSLNVHN